MYENFIPFKECSTSQNNIPLYEYTTFCIPTHQLMDFAVVSTFGCYDHWVLLWTFTGKCLVEQLNSVLWVIYLGVESLVHMELLHLTYWRIATLCSMVAEPFCIPTSNASGFQFLCILDSSINFWLAEWVLWQQWGQIPELFKLHLFNETILKQELETG